MVWSQFSIKILGAHFGNSVLDYSSWDKISHSLAKKINIWKKAQLCIWKCGLCILDIDTQLNSLELK